MPNNVTTENITKKDLIDNIKKTENIIDELNKTKNKLDNAIEFLDNIGTFIDNKIKIYMDTLNSNNFNEKSETESVEPKKIENNQVEKKDIKEEIKEKKLDISKFIEEFSQEFSFIDKEQFNDEMENDEIMGKIIELIKRMLGIKNNEINDKKIEINGLKIKKAKLEKDIAEKENKNCSLENEKVELEGKVAKINHKVADLESLKNKLEKDIENLNKEKSELNKDLENKKDEIIRLEGIEKDLEHKNSKLIEEKEGLNRENKEKDEKLKKFMKLFEEKENELKSIGDLLQAKKLYNKYLSMETKILSKLDNVLIQRDFESFISSGYTLSSLDNVWDIVKIEYKNISSKDKEILKEVFAFFLAQINKRFKEAKYGLVQVEVGEDFDAVNQVDLSQNSKGRVTECVFYGYGFLKEKENPNDEDIISRVIKSPLVLTA
ncbi:hypothetical protein KST15_01490 [Fusobacterium polymorphum]|uniref:hypothetical protein n=1 Tax=Fusobacterium nucleatum subsp. polymorphum TaxID=76857 RepID=UPI0030D02EF5